MRNILSIFLASCITTVIYAIPLLGPYEDTILPFNLSPGNVNPDTYFRDVYKEDVKPDTGSVESAPSNPDTKYPFYIPNSQSEESQIRNKRSPQHHGGYGHGHGHYDGGHHGGGHYGGGHHGGHYGGGHHGEHYGGGHHGGHHY